MILAHASVLRVCDQIHMRETWDAPRGPQTALCRCFPCSSLSVVSSVFPVPQDSPVQSSVPEILGLYCSTLCILPAAVTVRRLREDRQREFSGHTYHPLQALLPSGWRRRCPQLLGTWGPLLYHGLSHYGMT